MAIICFHKPDEENGYLSNWYMSDFSVDSITYSSMEQYMMYMKAKVFKDEVIANQILQTSNVAEIKALGRSVSNYEDSVWNGMRQLLVYKGLREKFAQNEDLKKRLLSTDNNYLAECAVNDRIWGIGLSMKDHDRLHIDKWKGQNLLGYTLMIVRSDVKQIAGME